MARLDFRILGPLEVRESERPLPLGGAKQRAVLALLLLDAGRVVSSDRLIDELWPERPPGRPQTAIQGYVSELRKLVEPKRKPGTPFEVLATEGPGYLLRLEPEQLDLHRFERLLDEGKKALAEGRAEVAARMLREALSLWRGPALADFAYESWAQGAIARLEELRLACLEERLEADLALGRHGELVGELEALIGEHPLRERLRGQLMLALYRSGRQAEALEAYQRARRSLVEELGIEPSAELQELNRAILRQEPGLALEPPPTPPMPSLPAPASPLVGRRRELAELHALLARPDVRLLTLTGAGGSGKTRLALALAEEQISTSGDGVCFCELAPIADPALVLPTVAQALGLKESGGEPLLERLKGFLRDRSLLLCLDNLEQVVAAAPELGELLVAAPALRLLVTSRERLRLRAEHEYPVEPLPLPGREALSDLEALAQVDAVALFLERAQAVKPDFRLTEENAAAIAAICRRLDGLPLALELAASRIKLLAPDTMLRRLEHSLDLLTGGPRDLPARQQTLRATIEWSYQLLSEAEQRLFARLAVFVGGCMLEAAEQVCEATVDTLASLVDKSLLREREGPRGEPRFSMLETVREYALERLEESGEADLSRRRHADYFLQVAAQAETELRGRKAAAWIDRLEAEHDNLRAALDSSLAAGDVELALQLLSALPLFWKARGHVTEARHRLAEALPESPAASAVRAEALWAAGYLAGAQADFRAAVAPLEESARLFRKLREPDGLILAQIELAAANASLGDRERAKRLAERSVVMARERGDAWLVCDALNDLAFVLGREDEKGNLDRVEALLEECVALARTIGYMQRLGSALNNLGWRALIGQDFERAVVLLEESLAVASELGDLDNRLYAVGNLGLAALLLHDDRRAAALFAEELTIAHRLGDAEHCAGGVQELAAVATAEGQALRAARLYGAACALYEAAGVPPWTLARAVQEQDERRLRSELGDSAFSAAWAEGRAMAREQAIAYALDLDWSARGTARRACPARPRPAPGPASGTRSRGRPRTRRGD